ncbi:RidA family protein [Ramlibacter sp.]|uniref:RidA family protein n=1 Tax=Ramlibacter sp. TaxID=1917967 RepID=UPI002D5440EE|nr:RidA family protein [Ramlibacter sp.]HYD76472.1 RidA family protein [Ramlibacter sp.]
MKFRKVIPAARGGESARFSDAIQAGNTLYVAAQIGVDANGVASPDVAQQCRQTWANMEAVLSEAGMGIENIVKTTVFLTDRADFPTYAAVRDEVFKGHKPATTLVYVSGLFKPELKVEIEAIAVDDGV